jgi:DNA gyrase subunit B
LLSPQFEGKQKTKLGNREVSPVSQAVGDMIEAYLEENPNDARIIVQKVILAAQARHAAKKAREMVQRKTVMGGGGFRKLSDCSEQDPAKCEVYLVEGDRQAEQQNKVVTVRFKQFCLYVVKF